MESLEKLIYFFCTDSAYEKELLSALPLTGHAFHKAEMKYHGNSGHTFVRMQHITLISRIDLCYATCRLATQTVTPTLPGFQGIKRCVQCLASLSCKPIFDTSNYYDGFNVIRFTWSVNQVEDHTTQNCLECHQYADHAIILNR